MFRWIKKWWIKDWRAVEKEEVRVRYGVVAGALGLASNLLLSAAKLAVGLITNSLSVVADAVNNLSDAGASTATLIGFKLSARPADRAHPYGHARYEYLTGLIVALLVLSAGVLLGKDAVDRILHPTPVLVNAATYAVLGGAVVLKLLQSLLYADFGKAIRSNALRAGAADSRNDVLITLSVLVGAIVSHTTGVSVDGYFSALVSLAIVISALKLIKDAFDPLLGAAPDKQSVARIRAIILSHPEVMGVHDLLLHNYGVNRTYGSVHAEIPADFDFRQGHALMDAIENEVLAKEHVTLTIHMDPIETDNPRVRHLEEAFTETLHALDPALEHHDFRLVNALTQTTVRCDVVLPYESKLTEAALEAALAERFASEEGVFRFNLHIDRK